MDFCWGGERVRGGTSFSSNRRTMLSFHMFGEQIRNKTENYLDKTVFGSDENI